jgi:NMD protein affecting ribosome stability and mRNA decay
MICCGQNRTTRFCPECGKPTKNALIGLLDHCRPQLEYCKTRLAHAGAKDSTCKRQAAVDKWQGWVDALEKAISEGDGTPEK